MSDLSEIISNCLPELSTTGISVQGSKVQVYTADVSRLYDSTVFATGYQQVSSYRKNKIDAFLFQKDKVLSLGVELLLMQSLIDSGIPPTNVKLDFIQNNKPCLKDYPEFQYNLSHSGTQVMCITGETPVGCDVEKISSVSLDFAEKCFFNSEIARIIAEKEGRNRDTLFFRYWTLKESFMKVTGLGMNLPLDAFEIIMSESDSIHVRQNISPDITYHFGELAVKDGYCYSFCLSTR